MNTSIRVRVADADDLAAAADTLAAAFEHYPWTRYVIPQEHYHERLRALQKLYLEYAQANGIVGVAGHCDGVIALLPPDAPEPEPGMVDEVMRLHGDRIGRLQQGDPPAGAWRVETLGVRPERQGQRLASTLLVFALAEAVRRGGEQVVLDTSDPRNVRLYERHGFHTTTHSDNGDGPLIWTMTATFENSTTREASL
ncbi:N-acetyltransferase [Corynebacterium suranareeae]|uniref:N-acetyltransferase n=1 Tax=Corynebacterium suranareeae TaxID=2506452 RepID=A0A160PP58_9CORY|nr:GNAT family N-acetyltransferase [Corynebacterium suranareeae]BAU95226.1 N-acetyltransferase [Corynebacterium suranareeae]